MQNPEKLRHKRKTFKTPLKSKRIIDTEKEMPAQRKKQIFRLPSHITTFVHPYFLSEKIRLLSQTKLLYIPILLHGEMLKCMVFFNLHASTMPKMQLYRQLFCYCVFVAHKWQSVLLKKLFILPFEL